MKRTTSYTIALLFLISSGTVTKSVPAAAQADCSQWSVIGEWEAIQSNNYRVQFKLQQRGPGLFGQAGYGAVSYQIPCCAIKGNVEGKISGNTIELNVDWGGVYLGKIDATGRIDGTTYDKRNSTSSASWYSDRRMNCLARGRESSPQSPTWPPAGPSSKGSTYSDRCPSGLVWRNVTETDHVCVAPAVRAQVRADNNLAAERRTGPPVRRPVCPSTGSCLRYDIPCKPGYVWRGAVSGDYVCVTQATKEQAQRDNLADYTRKLQQMVPK